MNKSADITSARKCPLFGHSKLHCPLLPGSSVSNRKLLFCLFHSLLCQLLCLRILHLIIAHFKITFTISIVYYGYCVDESRKFFVKPSLLISLFSKGISLKSTVVGLRNLGGVLINTSINSSYQFTIPRRRNNFRCVCSKKLYILKFYVILSVEFIPFLICHSLFVVSVQMWPYCSSCSLGGTEVAILC